MKKQNSNFLKDPKISIGAKGLLILLYDPSITTLDISNILSSNLTSKQELSQYLEELLSFKYIDSATCKKYQLLIDNSTAVVEPTIIENIINIPFDISKKKNPEKLNAYQKIVDYVDNYTNDNELRELLIKYFTLRIQKPKGTRFEKSNMYTNYIPKMLKTLDEFEDKKSSVLFTIQKQYYKFCEPSKDFKEENITSNSYTEKDKQLAQERLKNLDEVIFDD